MAGFAGAVRVVGNQRRAMTVCPSGAGYLCPCGEFRPIFATRRGGWSVPSTGGSRAHSVERRQASRDMRPDGVLSTLGATDELAGNGTSVPDQLGSGVSVGGMVCAVGLGAPGTARDRIHRRGRDSLGTRL